jgi:chromosomal replication initiator protein
MDANNNKHGRRRSVPKVEQRPIGQGRQPRRAASPISSVVATAADRGGSATSPVNPAAILSAFRAGIGDDRFDLWFADSLRVRVEIAGSGRWRVIVGGGTTFTQGWLQRRFHADFAAAVREACGDHVEGIDWMPLDETAPEAATAVEEPSPGADRDGAAMGGACPPMPAARGLVPNRAITASPGPVDRPTSTALSAPGPSRQSAGGRMPLTLEDYVVGAGNRMAHAAAVLAADDPGAMSPLVIHGPGGAGKTHLLEGIGRRLRERLPRAATLMLSAEQFTTSFLEALHGRRGLPGFRRSLRSADLVVIDDIQFLIGKKATVSELLHTLDALHRAGKQVVFAADRDVESLAELGADFQTRLRGGMSARILPPDEATRGGIVESLAARRGIVLPADVVRFVAGRMTRNSRELAGAVNRLEATSHMLGVPVTLGMAQECLADLVRSSSRAVRLPDIERAVCTAFGVDAGSLQSACRARRVNHPRMLAMFLARKHTPAALAEIGCFFGRRSHSTVISAQRTVDGWIASGSRLTLADAEWGIEEAIRRVEEALQAG